MVGDSARLVSEGTPLVESGAEAHPVKNRTRETTRTTGARVLRLRGEAAFKKRRRLFCIFVNAGRDATSMPVVVDWELRRPRGNTASDLTTNEHEWTRIMGGRTPAKSVSQARVLLRGQLHEPPSPRALPRKREERATPVRCCAGFVVIRGPVFDGPSAEGPSLVRPQFVGRQLPPFHLPVL